MKGQDKAAEQPVPDPSDPTEVSEARQQTVSPDTTQPTAQAPDQALRDSEERFRIALKDSKIVVYNQDRDLRYTWIYNPQLGFRPEDILGKTDAELLAPEDAARLEVIKRQVLESGIGVRETVRTAFESEAYYYDLTVEPLRDASGDIIGVTGASRDITERVHAEEALKESELRFKAQYRGLPIPVYTWQKHGQDFALTDYNHAAEEITQGMVAQLVGTKASEFYKDSPDILQQLWQCYTEERSLQREILYHFRTTKESKYLSVSYGFVPPDLVLVHTEDVSERRRAESERDTTLQTLHQRTHELGERVKELDCLYGMSRLRERRDLTMQELLQQTVELIPPAWQHPEIAGARIVLGDQSFHTEQFRADAPWRQASDIIVAGHREGVVEVCYLEQRPEQGEGPFLKEERALLGAVAERLARISEHKQAEQQSETILKTAIDGFWICDAGGRIVDVNDSLCQMLGYGRQELLSMSISDVEALETAYDVEQHIVRILANGYDRFESRLVSKQGELIDIEASVSYLDATKGHVFAFIRDITERKQAEIVLRDARDELQLRIQQRTAELQRANESLREEIAQRRRAQQETELVHQRELVLSSLLRISMQGRSLEEQLEQALHEILATPWLPVLRQGAIFLVGDEPETLELRTQQGLSVTIQATCARVDFGQCLCGRAAASRDLQFADRVDHRHEIVYEGLEPHGHYCIPILSGDTTLGTVVLYLEEGHPRDHQQEEFLGAVAHTLAGIVERKRAESERDATLQALQGRERQLRALNEQLEEYGRSLAQRVAARTREIEQRRQVAESLRDILTVLNSNRPLGEILDHIVAEASRLLGSDTSAIYRRAEPGGVFSVQTAQGLEAEAVADLLFPPGTDLALRRGQPVAISDVASAFPEERGQERARTGATRFLPPNCQALLAVPLTVADAVYGGLVLYYSEARAFSGEEIGLAVAFGDQAALAIENARLRQHAREAAVIEERARLARDLHDSVTQSLYSLTLLAEGWKRLAKAGRLADSEDPLTEVGAIAQQALKEMRLMVHELRPPDLEEEGLLGALHQRLGAVEKRAGVEARLVADDVVELPVVVEEGLYRIAVEALNNALKHADATSVIVRIRASEGVVELEVADDGRGLDPAAIAAGGGMGLAGMRERAEKLGGKLTIDSAPGEGTRVRATAQIHELL